MAAGRHILTKTPIALGPGCVGEWCRCVGTGAVGGKAGREGSPVAVTALERGRHYSSHPVTCCIKIHITAYLGVVFSV